MSRTLALAAIAIGLGGPAAAHAQPANLDEARARPDPAARDGPSDDEPVVRSRRWLVVVAENLLVLAPPTIYYYATTNLQREDFELEWDWTSWQTKLTTVDAVVLDTGNWVSNALRHPLAGELSYQAARASGFDPLVATTVDLAAGVVWEYVVEYREQVSLNDLVVNVLSGYLLGEPLFQIGRVADAPGAGVVRTGLGWLASPFHRLHAAVGRRSWRSLAGPAVRVVARAGGGTVDHGGVERGEVVAGIDVELVRDARPDEPGRSAGRLLRAWRNQAAVEVRADREGVSRVRARTRTSYGGRWWRADDADVGGEVRVDLAAGIDYDTRRLTEETDRLIVFHVIGPRAAADAWRGDGRLTGELTVAADLGMVQAHVFGPVLPFPPLPQRSVLQSRGYYYAAGGSASGRLAAHHGRWHAAVEGTAYLLWSIDGRDRHELEGGVDDPHDVSDRRLVGAITAAVDLARGFHGGLAVEGVVRRGAWADQVRQTGELDVGAWLGVDF